MNILLAHFQIQDYGGIINYSEHLAQGIKKLGSSVGSIILKNKGITGDPSVKDRSEDPEWQFGEGLELWMHQKKGWEGMYQLNYIKDISIWEELTDNYDLIIYVIPVPTCTKDSKDVIEWLELFKTPMAKQVAVVHDGNMQKLYPHIIHICDYLDGIVCVHDAAYNSSEVLPIRRAFIPNPHDISHPFPIKTITSRHDGFVSLQTFKRWKRVDDLIKAIPYMDEFYDKIVCGGGIEYHYMTSKDKCKKEYMLEDGSRIWDNAVEAGMEYKGYINTEDRDILLANNKLLVDPSWSKNYSELGCHFNRVMVEAMSHGCIPVCTDLAMKNSRLFKPNINYIEIPYNCSPGEYADRLMSAIDNEKLLLDIQQNNLKILNLFESSYIAHNIIGFAFSADIDNNFITSVGHLTDDIKQKADKKMQHFDELW